MVTFSLTLDCDRTAFANLAIFSTLFPNLNDDPFHKHDKRLFCQITNQLIACKNVCGRKYVASEPRLLGTRQASSTRAARNARQAACGQHDPAQCRTHRPPPPLFRWETEKCNSANSAESPPAPTSPQACCLPRRDQP